MVCAALLTAYGLTGSIGLPSPSGIAPRGRRPYSSLEPTERTRTFPDRVFAPGQAYGRDRTLSRTLSVPKTFVSSVGRGSSKDRAAELCAARWNI